MLKEEIPFSSSFLSYMAWLCYIMCPCRRLHRSSSLVQVYIRGEGRECTFVTLCHEEIYLGCGPETAASEPANRCY